MPVQMIPLNKLVAGNSNVRKTDPDVGVEALAANIEALGLLENLVVSPSDGERFAVEAGMRRWRALKLLAKRKVIAKDEPIACNVLVDGGPEISLAENIMREPMHPADQYEAFKALADQGKGPEEIAARFGCSPLSVNRRLKLASVSPSLLDCYREGEMDLDQLMAFTVGEDHSAQEKIWAALPVWNRHPATIRRLLTQTHVEATDRRARFIGLDAYVAAGGVVLRDLFEAEHEGYLTDPALLDRLIAEKLEREAEAIRAEGWKWVEIVAEFDYQGIHDFGRVYPERSEPTAEQQAEIDQLTEAYDALVAEHGDDPPEAVAAELERMSDRIDALTSGTVTWVPEDIGRAGVMIGIGHSGQLAVERGLVHQEDEPARPPTDRGKAKANGKGQGSDHGPSPLPDRLVEDLTAQRTAALRSLLAGNPEVAIVAVAHVLALSLFYHRSAESCLCMRLDVSDLRSSAGGIEDSPAGKTLAQRHEHWKQRLPANAEQLWAWLLSQDTAVRLDLIAYCAGCSIDAVRRPGEHTSSGRLLQADRLAEALGLDMSQWWQPTADSYLKHVPKARILEAVAEGVSREASENLMKLKKDALVAHAEERLVGTGWLPAMLRAPLPPATSPDVVA